jgi:alcohol dehydrogenase YqhD (iron-dependent ADH family)
MTSYDEKIVKNLKLAAKIERKNFEKIIASKKYDVVMFVIDTDFDKESEHISKYINKVCERFKSLGIKSVLFTYYDMNENGPLFHGTVN